MITNPRVGMRARFTGKDDFHPPVREGKLGTIVADANLENGTNWGDGCCMWEIDGTVGWYVTALADLEEEL